VLTLLMSVFTGERGMELVSARFVINLIISLSIGAFIEAARLLILDRLDLESRPPAVQLALLAAAMGASVLAGTEVARALTGALFPGHARSFPREAVLLVAVPITVAMTARGVSHERLERKAATLEASEAVAREQLLRAQLEALKARTNP